MKQSANWCEFCMCIKICVVPSGEGKKKWCSWLEYAQNCLLRNSDGQSGSYFHDTVVEWQCLTLKSLGNQQGDFVCKGIILFVRGNWISTKWSELVIESYCSLFFFLSLSIQISSFSFLSSLQSWKMIFFFFFFLYLLIFLLICQLGLFLSLQFITVLQLSYSMPPPSILNFSLNLSTNRSVNTHWELLTNRVYR